MQLIKKYHGLGDFTYPHGCTFNPNATALYVTAQYGNFIYKIDISDIQNPNIKQIVLEPGELPDPVNHEFNPHQVRFAPDDNTKYFVTCEEGDAIRIFNAANDSLMAAIPTCHDIEEMDFAPQYHLLFATSYEDKVTFTPRYGCISIINYLTNTLIKNIYPGFEPHSIAVDEVRGLVYVANRNIDFNGPTPYRVLQRKKRIYYCH